MNLFTNWFKKPQHTEDYAVFIARNNNNNELDFYLSGQSKELKMNLLLSLTLGKYIQSCLQHCEEEHPGFAEEYQTYLQSIDAQIQENNKNRYISPLE